MQAMFKSFRVGSVLGIPIRLDITFLLILPVFAFLIGSEIEALVNLLEPVVPVEMDVDRLTGPYLDWVIGFAAALGLFLCVALHELGHSITAMRYDYHIESITLWIFGGIAQLTETPRRWHHEFYIAIAGPLVSVAIGILVFAPLYVIAEPDIAVFLLAYLAVMNIALAGFNMLPAFPMDGGRVLRSLLARKRSLARATKLASETGKVFALLLGLWGLFTFNPLLVGIALFIYIAAAGEAERTMMEAALSGISVEEVMTPIDQVRLVSPRTSIAQVIDRMFKESTTGYPVVKRARPIGLITLADAQSVAEFEREAMEVRDVMSTEVETVYPWTEAMESMRRMSEANVDRLLVVDGDGDLVGVVSQRDVMRVFDLIKGERDWNRAVHRHDG